MKKILIIALAVILLCASTALADPDPIVGTWYSMMDDQILLDAISSASDEYAGIKRVVTVMTFEENGNISYSEFSYYDGRIEPMTKPVCGTWEKKLLGGYTVKLIGAGEHTARLSGNVLYAPLSPDKVLAKFYKMTPFDIYNDYVPE